jgi:hypothetical protein
MARKEIKEMKTTLFALALAVAPLTFAAPQPAATPAKPAAAATTDSKPAVKKHHKKAAKKTAAKPATTAADPAKK